MANVMFGQIIQENSTFMSEMSTEENFRSSLIWYEGDEVYDFLESGAEDFTTGMLKRAKELNMDITNTFCAAAQPSGTITKECYGTLKRKLLEGVKKGENIDGVCFAFHGAGVAEDVEDIEGDLLIATREILGKDIPIIITLDLHANVTRKMIEKSTAILSVKTYPHVDTYQTGIKAVNLMNDIINLKVNPIMVAKKMPLLLSISKGTTLTSPAKDVKELSLEIEKDENIIDCTFVHGFPYSDITESSSTVIAISNGDTKLAEKACNKLYDYVWNNRNLFVSDYPDVKEGLDIVENMLKNNIKNIVVNESSDNPGAGTPGDGTFLLRELLKRNIPKTCFGCICDSEVVSKAIEAGVGNTIDICLGAKKDNFHGTPIELEDVYVKSISDGKVNLLGPMNTGLDMNYGKCVTLKVGNVDIVVCSIAVQVYDESIFNINGMRALDYDVIGVKSAQHFKAYFSTITDNIVTVDPPGLSTGNLNFFKYKKLTRPIFPLDDM